MGKDIPVYWDPDKGKLYWFATVEDESGTRQWRQYIDSYIR